MSGVLKTIGQIAAIALNFVPGVGTIASAAILIGLQVGSALLAKPPAAKGSVNTFTIGNNQPTPYSMGESYLAGALVYDVGYGGSVSGVQNPYRFTVSVLSCAGPIQSYTGYYADFKQIATSAGAISGYYSGFLYVDAQFGTRPESNQLTSGLPAPPDWGSAHKLSGYAAVAWSLRFDRAGKKFSSGVPQLGVVAKWVKVYDPRADSTYPGGTGSHRINDESTWQWSDNPALHALTYAYGRYVNGKKVFGVDLGASAIYLPDFVAWANVCDTNRWTCNGTIYEPGQGVKWNNLKSICQSGAAEPVIVGGLLRIRYQAPRATLDTITADDLADGTPPSIQRQRPWKERINGCTPRWRSSAHQWTYVQGNLVQDAAARAADGEDKIEEVQFDLVTNVGQAAQLAGYRVGDAREVPAVTLELKPRLMGYHPGELLKIDIPTMNLSGDWLILSRTINPDRGTVVLTFQSETAAKHSWALSQTGTVPATKVIPTAQERDGVYGDNTNTAPSEIDGGSL